MAQHKLPTPKRKFSTKSNSCRYTQGDDPTKRKLHVSWWHRGHNPQVIASARNLKEPKAIAKYVAYGWLPEHPVITKGMKTLVMGSCFAERTAIFLRYRSKIACGKKAIKTQVKYRFPHTAGGIDPKDSVYLFVYGAGFQTTYSALHQLEWALGERDIDITKMYNAKGKELYAGTSTGKDTQAFAHKALMDSAAFIINFNTAEIWYDKRKRYTFFGAIPNDCLQKGKFQFGITKVEDNVVALKRIYELIRGIKPKAPIIYNIAPIPLMTTHRRVSCASANTVSKAILRVSVDEHMRAHGHDPRMLYLPLYEIVDAFPGNAYMPDRRHLKPAVRNAAFKLLDDYYIRGGKK